MDEHPSIDTDQAYFIFAMCTKEKNIRRLLVVEAENHARVAVIERIIALSGGKPSHFCENVAVFRTSDIVGLRSSLVDECSYIDFVIDICSPEHLHGEHMLISEFMDTLSIEERRLLAEKLSHKSNVPAVVEETKKAPEAKKTSEEAKKASDDDFDKLIEYVAHTGYTKKQIQKCIDENRKKLSGLRLEDQFKIVVSNLS